MLKELTEATLTGDILFEWNVKEYDEHERPRSWYLVVGGLGLFFLLFGVFTNNFLFSLFILLVGIVLYLQAHQKPLHVPVAITELGLIVGRRFYTYSEFLEFYILMDGRGRVDLFFEPKTMMQPRIHMDVCDVDPLALREFLGEVLEENLEKEELPISEQFRRGWLLH